MVSCSAVALARLTASRSDNLPSVATTSANVVTVRVAGTSRPSRASKRGRHLVLDAHLAVVILGIGLLQGRSYLAWVMAEFLPMLEEGWMKLTRRLTAFFAGLAVANEAVWRTMSTDAWVKIETFGFPILMFLFLWIQILTLQRYLIDEDGAS